MKKRMWLLLSGIGMFVLYLGYTYMVAREYLNKLDFDIMVRLQDNIPTRFDPFFSSFSLLGSVELTAVIFTGVIIFFSFKKWRRLFTLSSYFFFHVIEILFKFAIDQVAPPFMFHRYAFEYHFPSTYVSADYFSYPSGHVGRTALLIGLFSYIVWQSKRSLLVKCMFWALLAMIFIIMVISRISLGEHWFSDVVGGVLLGFSFALFSAVLW